MYSGESCTRCSRTDRALKEWIQMFYCFYTCARNPRVQHEPPAFFTTLLYLPFYHHSLWLEHQTLEKKSYAVHEQPVSMWRCMKLKHEALQRRLIITAGEPLSSYWWGGTLAVVHTPLVASWVPWFCSSPTFVVVWDHFLSLNHLPMFWVYVKCLLSSSHLPRFNAVVIIQRHHIILIQWTCLTLPPKLSGFLGNCHYCKLMTSLTWAQVAVNDMSVYRENLNS